MAFTNFDEIYQNANQNGSLIKLRSLTNQTRIFFSKIQLLNNNCQYCLNGLIWLELIDFENAKISELLCMMNQLTNYGCIFAKSDNNIGSFISIYHSNFISNNGQKGGGVYVENIKFQLRNSMFFNNTVSQKGGGFYFSQGSESCLNQNNFVSSLLFYNFAKQSSNNINELPKHLSLSINQIEMFSQEKLIEDRLYQVLQLKPYKIILQDHAKSTNFLFIPSGQQISTYQFYNPKHQIYQPYIFNLNILLKNSMNELLINYQNYSCYVEQISFDNASQQLIESIRISKLNFNQDVKGLTWVHSNLTQILISRKTEFRKFWFIAIHQIMRINQPIE
ncbi:unnamed protein product [Paramecium octaurelia]|uniref:Uncharacterized protein n=1 Tax=Paramecium octaurelia TaxID=43137 RepID=A0A8S1SGX6_PAROT|nr:unnamed protein product [Paramecium octaurelia]